MKTFVITGATGFVGKHIVQILSKAGHKSIALCRHGSNVAAIRDVPGVTIAYFDGQTFEVDRLSLNLLSEAQGAALIHCGWAGVAGESRNALGQLENIAFTLAMVKLAGRYKFSHVVGVGSQAEYGPKLKRISESDTLQPTTLYGYAKASAYFASAGLAAELGVPFSWVRIFSTYGPGDANYWLIPSVIDALLAHEPLQLTPGEQEWDYLFVEDTAKALIAVATLESGIGAVNLGSGQTIKVMDLVLELGQLIDSSRDISFGALPYRKDQVMLLHADTKKLTELTGWRPEVSLTEGLRLTIASRARNLEDCDF